MRPESIEGDPSAGWRAAGLLALYTATIFVSAVLLFLVQPMFARMVLPLLGGSPAVWNTALVFYQATLLVPLHLAVLFAASLMCHGEIARDRPSPRHLTEFYGWMSLGGVLGGSFNALIAPRVFSDVFEYPLMIVLACALIPASALAPLAGAATKAPADRRGRVLDALLPCLLGAGMAAVLVALPRVGVSNSALATSAVLVTAILVCFGWSRRPLRFGLGVAAILLFGQWHTARQEGGALLTRRSFFGVHRVTRDAQGRFFQLVHGNTLHGKQSRSAQSRHLALSYYHASGPIGQVFREMGASRREVGVVGLGVGTLAAYARPDQKWTYFEIDPEVEAIARDARFFTFLRDSRADARVVLGDARLKLREVASGRFDLLVLDAYSSDAIPVHLMTREAVALYIQKLAPDGVLAFHISNRHLDLEPMLGNLLREAGLVALAQTDARISTRESEEGK
jgi:hypothetical protein